MLAVDCGFKQPSDRKRLFRAWERYRDFPESIAANQPRAISWPNAELHQHQQTWNHEFA